MHWLILSEMSNSSASRFISLWNIATWLIFSCQASESAQVLQQIALNCFLLVYSNKIQQYRANYLAMFFFPSKIFLNHVFVISLKVGNLQNMIIMALNVIHFQPAAIKQSFPDCLFNVWHIAHKEDSFYSAQQQKMQILMVNKTSTFALTVLWMNPK